jgi:hypothetical protein
LAERKAITSADLEEEENEKDKKKKKGKKGSAPQVDEKSAAKLSVCKGIQVRLQ